MGYVERRMREADQSAAELHRYFERLCDGTQEPTSRELPRRLFFIDRWATNSAQKQFDLDTEKRISVLLGLEYMIDQDSTLDKAARKVVGYTIEKEKFWPDYMTHMLLDGMFAVMGKMGLLDKDNKDMTVKEYLSTYQPTYESAS